jgi:hypothetical protein
MIAGFELVPKRRVENMKWEDAGFGDGSNILIIVGKVGSLIFPADLG